MQNTECVKSSLPTSDSVVPDPSVAHQHFLPHAVFLMLYRSVRKKAFPYVIRLRDIHLQVVWCLCNNLAGVALVLWSAWGFKRVVQKHTGSLISPLAGEFCLIKATVPPANFVSCNLFVSSQNVPCLAPVVQSRSVCYLSKFQRLTFFPSSKRYTVFLLPRLKLLKL